MAAKNQISVKADYEGFGGDINFDATLFWEGEKKLNYFLEMVVELYETLKKVADRASTITDNAIIEKVNNCLTKYNSVSEKTTELSTKFKRIKDLFAAFDPNLIFVWEMLETGGEDINDVGNMDKLSNAYDYFFSSGFMSEGAYKYGLSFDKTTYKVLTPEEYAEMLKKSGKYSSSTSNDVMAMEEAIKQYESKFNNAFSSFMEQKTGISITYDEYCSIVSDTYISDRINMIDYKSTLLNQYEQEKVNIQEKITLLEEALCWFGDYLEYDENGCLRHPDEYEKIFLEKYGHDNYGNIEDFRKMYNTLLQLFDSEIITESKLKELYAELCNDYQIIENYRYVAAQEYKVFLFQAKYPISEDYICIDDFKKSYENRVVQGAPKLDLSPNSPTQLYYDGEKVTIDELAKHISPAALYSLFVLNANHKFSDKKYEAFAYMTDEQLLLYNQYYYKYGKGVADQYLETIQDSINAEKGKSDAIKKINEATDPKTGKVNWHAIYIDGVEVGTATWWEGVENCFGAADGVKTALQYEQLYYMQWLLNSSGMYVQELYDKKLNQYGSEINEEFLHTDGSINLENVKKSKYLTDSEKKILEQKITNDQNQLYNFMYEFGNTVGNVLPSMTISLLCSAIPLSWAGILGSLAGNIAMGVSIYGNSLNEALISGNSLDVARWYACLSSLSETALSMVLGAIPGLNETSQVFLENILKEGAEEYLQEYVSAGIKSATLNEPINIDELNEQALKSFYFGCLMSGLTNSVTCDLDGWNVNPNAVGTNAYGVDMNTLVEFISAMDGQNVKLEHDFYGLKSVFCVEDNANVDSAIAKISAVYPDVPIVKVDSNGNVIEMITNGNIIKGNGINTDLNETISDLQDATFGEEELVDMSRDMIDSDEILNNDSYEEDIDFENEGVNIEDEMLGDVQTNTSNEDISVLISKLDSAMFNDELFGTSQFKEIISCLSNQQLENLLVNEKMFKYFYSGDVVNAMNSNQWYDLFAYDFDVACTLFSKYYSMLINSDIILELELKGFDFNDLISKLDKVRLLGLFASFTQQRNLDLILKLSYSDMIYILSNSIAVCSKLNINISSVKIIDKLFNHSNVGYSDAAKKSIIINSFLNDSDGTISDIISDMDNTNIKLLLDELCREDTSLFLQVLPLKNIDDATYYFDLLKAVYMTGNWSSCEAVINAAYNSDCFYEFSSYLYYNSNIISDFPVLSGETITKICLGSPLTIFNKLSELDVIKIKQIGMMDERYFKLCDVDLSSAEAVFNFLNGLNDSDRTFFIERMSLENTLLSSVQYELYSKYGMNEFYNSQYDADYSVKYDEISSFTNIEMLNLLNQQFGEYITDEQLALLPNVTNFMTDFEYSMSFINAEYTLGINSADGTYVNLKNEVYKIKSTVVHESIHALARTVNGTGFTVGGVEFTGLNEVFTEYFTKMTMGDNYPTKLTGKMYCNYEVGVLQLERLTDNGVLDIEMLKKSYFGNDIGYIKDTICNLSDETTYNEMLAAFSDIISGDARVQAEANVKLDDIVEKLINKKNGIDFVTGEN